MINSTDNILTTKPLTLVSIQLGWYEPKEMDKLENKTFPEFMGVNISLYDSQGAQRALGK